jgi:GTP-binding protein
MPQTRYVLQQALGYGLKPIVVINKIDRPEIRVQEVKNEIDDLFLELAIEESQLDYPVPYASARVGAAKLRPQLRRQRHPVTFLRLIQTQNKMYFDHID